MRRLIKVSMLVVLTFSGACGSDAQEGTYESTSTIAADSDTSVAADSGAESCVADSGALGERAFAFDGTVIATSEEVDPKYPEPDVPLPRATFEVHDWFTGGSNETVEVWMQRDVVAGERLLVTGEPRWGGEPLEDAIAWECSFTMPTRLRRLTNGLAPSPADDHLNRHGRTE